MNECEPERNGSPLNWPAIKDAYVNGALSLRATATHFGLSDAAIRKRAKKENWPARSGFVPKVRTADRRVGNEVGNLGSALRCPHCGQTLRLELAAVRAR